MIDTHQIAKWSVVPVAIVLAQISLNALGAFDTETGVWAFVIASLLILLVWRHRLGKWVLPFADGNVANVKGMVHADRRFAFLSMATPFATLLLVQLSIILLVWLAYPLVQRHSGTLWTLFAVIAIGYQPISLCINLWIVAHNTRWRKLVRNDDSYHSH